MILLRPMLIACVALAAFVSVVTAADSDLEKEFRSVQRTILSQLKSKKPEQRVEAVRRLEKFPIVEAAKILLLQGLASSDEEVRRASYGALLKFKEEKEIGLFLADSVVKDLKRGAVDQGTCGALAVLLASENPDLQKRADELVGQAAMTPKGGPLLLISLADELGAEADDASLTSLVKLTKLPLFTAEFGFRRAVTQNLTRVRKPGAMTALIGILETAQGEVRSDILRYLTTASGQKLGADPKAWLAWWKTNQATFKFPAADQPLVKLARADLAAKGAESGSYYGLPLLASRIVFVMDTSLSMHGARIEAAKRELIKAISELPETTHFGVLVFNSRTTAWQAKLVPATSENKDLACRFVALQDLGPATASYDALEAALSFDAEAIYFLTDGAPFGGKITRPVDIVTVISKLNRLRRMTVNSIGIGVGQEGNVFDAFLKALATQNFGEYIRVDQ